MARIELTLYEIIPAKAAAIPAKMAVIPAKAVVIPAKAGIQLLQAIENKHAGSPLSRG